MRILVDARLLHGGGIGRYLREVSRRWLVDSRVEGIRFLGRPEELEPWLDEEDARGIGSVASFPFSPYSARAQLDWARRRSALEGDTDVAFFPHYDVPLFRHPDPSVVVVHDLTQYRLPDCFPRSKTVAGRFLLAGAVRRARRVVTVSEASRSDLSRDWPETEGKVTVVYPGVSRVFRPMTEEEASDARARHRAIVPFLLMVGSSRPHKNLQIGPRILAGLRDRWPDLQLVVVGTGGADGSALARAAEAVGVRERVVELGRVDDDVLRELYGLTEVFLFPSLYEGFGLPPLEAMSCGSPVVAADRGALPEVLSGHAILVDPESPEGWTREVHRILSTAPPTMVGEDVGRRERIRYARGYSWDRAAERIFETLRSAAGRPSRAVGKS